MTTSTIGNAFHLAAAAVPDGGGGFSWGTLFLFVGGAFLLAIVSGLGILARMRDRRNERLEEERLRARRETEAGSSPTAVERGPDTGPAA